MHLKKIHCHTMNIARFLLFAPLFFIVATSARAQMTAIELQNMCSSHYDVDAGMCGGYIKAIAEQLMSDHDPRAKFCLSPAIGPQNLVENVQRGWATRPPKPEDLAFDSVTGVLKDRFRCM